MINRITFSTMLLFAQSAGACPTQDGALSLVPADAVAPAAFVTFDAPPISAPFEMTFEFCSDAGKKITAMAFDAIMPAHQHGMNYRAKVANTNEEVFRVSNVVFHMPGRWELRIEAETADQTFAYTGEVAVE